MKKNREVDLEKKGGGNWKEWKKGNFSRDVLKEKEKKITEGCYFLAGSKDNIQLTLLHILEPHCLE